MKYISSKIFILKYILKKSGSEWFKNVCYDWYDETECESKIS